MKSLIFCGYGNLGRSFIKVLKSTGISAINIDLNFNEEAENNIIVDRSKNLSEQLPDLKNKIKGILKGESLCSLFCSAGGWQGGSICDNDFLTKFSDMNKLNVETSALSCHLASNFLAKNGLLLLTGASIALRPTPLSLAYGVSKSSTHFMVQSVAIDPYFLGEKITVLGILPQVIDTTENRRNLSNEDSENWAKV